MELVRVLGKDPGPPPTYHVIFRVVADHGRHSCPSWLTEKLICRACPPPADRGAKRLLREYDESAGPPKRWRTAEPTEPVEPAAPVELAEPKQDAGEKKGVGGTSGVVAEAAEVRRSEGSSRRFGITYDKERGKWIARR